MWYHGIYAKHHHFCALAPTTFRQIFRFAEGTHLGAILLIIFIRELYTCNNYIHIINYCYYITRKRRRIVLEIYTPVYIHLLQYNILTTKHLYICCQTNCDFECWKIKWWFRLTGSFLVFICIHMYPYVCVTEREKEYAVKGLPFMMHICLKWLCRCNGRMLRNVLVNLWHRVAWVKLWPTKTEKMPERNNNPYGNTLLHMHVYFSKLLFLF